MFPFKYKDTTEPKLFDVVSFKVYDSDDYVTLTFIGILHTDHVIYISGGMDCGLAMGNKMSFEEVIALSENNDEYDQGIIKVGTHYQISSIIARGFGV